MRIEFVTGTVLEFEEQGLSASDWAQLVKVRKSWTVVTYKKQQIWINWEQVTNVTIG